MTGVEPDAFLGREIAGYRVEEVIGRGGMGVVYRAEHLRLGRKVALKVVAPQIAREEKFRERFLRESRTAGSLDHPNVVPMYDAGEADGVLYIAMRFVDGVDLGSLIAREGPLEPARAARIVAQVASALDAAHEAGLVHRDVKPSNVLLPARGAGRGEHAYLGDFGLTKRVLSESGVTGSSAFIGTIAYVAPEQIEGQAVDGKADQYSLACLTYEVLTGRRPYERETDIATLYAHIRDPFPSVADAIPAGLVPSVDAILARGAAKRPSDRYPSSGDMAEDLLRATGAGAGDTGPVSVVAKQKPGRNRRRILAGCAVVLAILLVAGFGLYRVLSPPAPLLVGHGLVAIDATTGAARAATTFDDEPSGVAADPTAAWVLLPAADRVARVDAADDAVRLVRVGRGPQAIASGDLAAEGEAPEFRIWVANTTDETLSGIDAGQPDRGATFMSPGFRPGALAFGSGLVWVIDSQADEVARVNPQPLGLAEEGPIGTGAGPEAITAGGDTVWVANGLGQSLTRIATTIGTAEAPIELDFTPTALALDVDSGALWVVDTDGDAVIRFDTTTRQEVARIENVGQTPVAIAVGAGSVWVANEFEGSVARIDPATNTVIATIRIGGAPQGIAVSGTTVWVSVAAP